MSWSLLDTSQKPVSIESVLDKLTISGQDVSVVVNTPLWNEIPLLIRDWDGKGEATMCRLLDEISRILTDLSYLGLPLVNKRLLHNSLSTLSQTPKQSTQILTRVRQCMIALEYVQDGPLTILTIAEVEQMKKECEEAKKEKKRSETENQQLTKIVADLKRQLANLPIWFGTESLQTLDRAVHTLTPTTLTQIIVPSENHPWRTAFTFPIEEGEWELKIRIVDFDPNLMLGFLKHPLPEDAKQKCCGRYSDGSGGHFKLYTGSLWKSAKEFQPAKTNQICVRYGQTAAIRVNMWTREARLVVDEEEQPGVFTDIPSPLCLGLSTGFFSENRSVEVLSLAHHRGNDELERAMLEKKRTLKSTNEELNQQLAVLPIWNGTTSLQPLEKNPPRNPPTTPTKAGPPPPGYPLRTSFTFPIIEGEWELKIRNVGFDPNVSLGFLRHPLPQDATERHCGMRIDGSGGHFTLFAGSLWKSVNKFKPAGTNKKCDKVGQIAAIRVNMRTREARLFVDDEEQPGIFTDIPSPLCLGITTGWTKDNQSVEVLWLKRLRGNDEIERAMVEEGQALKSEPPQLKQQLTNLPIWVGTESLQTLDRTAHKLTPTTLTQVIKLDTGSTEWRTAFTLPIVGGEWELKIRCTEQSGLALMLGFLRQPLPEDATRKSCGSNCGGIGGDFILWSGGMWKDGEFKPAGTNKKWERVGQTAAIRVSMMTREARLVVDDAEQPGIFTDIPSPLCLGITTQLMSAPIEVLWLKRLRS